MATYRMNNIENIFAQISTVDELKGAANDLCQQIKGAYDKRRAEIMAASQQAVAEVMAEVEAVQDEAKAVKGRKAKADATAATKATAKTAAKADAKGTAKAEDTPLISITDKAAIKKLGLKFEKYSEKSFVLRGDTKPLRKELKERFNGMFNSHLKGGAGWIFKAEKVKEVAKALGVKAAV